MAVTLEDGWHLQSSSGDLFMAVFDAEKKQVMVSY